MYLAVIRDKWLFVRCVVLHTLGITDKFRIT